jgi:PTS system cellobiose-specific IIC component
MQSLMNWINKRLIPPLVAIAEERHIRAIRDGMQAVLPLIMVGSFALILGIFAQFIPAVQLKLGQGFIEIFNLTMGVMGLGAAFSVAYSLAKIYELDPQTTAIVSASAFLLSIPVTLMGDPSKGPVTDYTIASRFLGGEGLIVGILVALLTAEVTRFFTRRRLTIRMPPGVPPGIAAPFQAIVPAAATLLIVWTVRVLLGISIHDVVLRLVRPLLAATDTLPALLLAVLLINLLWSVGIHGAMVVTSILLPLILPLLAANAEAAARGARVLPHVVTEGLVFWFVAIGGVGGTLGLVILMLRSKSARLRQVARLSLLPAIFNINEPVIFGMPIMLNPMLFIPFILGTLVTTTIAYSAMALNLVGRVSAEVPFVLPFPIGAYMATRDWKAIPLACINLAINTAIWYPFYKSYEMQMLKAETSAEESV